MEKLTIVKVGGKSISNFFTRNFFIKNFSMIAGYKMLVHGGGPILAEFAKRLNIKTQMVSGRRITSKEILDLAVMVYAGLINKKIVSELQAYGVNALGFTGTDADVIRSSKRLIKNNIDYGLVGDIQKINIQLVNEFISKNYTLVFAPITHDGKGQLLNTNADSIAGELAKVLVHNYNVQLVYCFDKKGVLYNEEDESTIFSTLKYVDFQRYRKERIIKGGMLPKLENAFKALSEGVKKVIITNISDINHWHSGTCLKL